jgi:hypothetical protein
MTARPSTASLPWLAVLGLTAAASAQFSFDPGANIFVGLQPSGAAAGDFNGDGVPDLAVTTDVTQNADNVAILIGGPTGTFAAPFYINLPNGSSPEALAAGDLDGDGDIDLAVGLKGPNQVMSLINGGGANFVLGATAPTGLEPRGMDIADADGDGDFDLVVANRDGNTATFLRNSGSATFTATTLAAGAEPRDAVFGDFDADGDFDIAVSNHDDRTVTVYRNNGAGVYTSTATLSVGGNDRPDGMDTGDLNGDGRDDIAAASGDDQVTGQNRAVVFFAQSASAFTGPMYVAAGAVLDTSDVVVADLDCDGDLDLATANRTTNNVSLMANNGAGAFGPATLFAAGAGSDTLIAADLMADGDADLVSVNRNSSNITVYLSTCGTAVPVCGNGICEAGENNGNCPGDCPPPVCGNGVCEFGENSITCPADCGGGGQNPGPAGTFTMTSTNLTVGSQPSGAAAGDFNGDGIPDLAVTADLNNNDNVAILIGNGDGTFAAPFYVVLPSSSSPEAVVAGDLDGDGDVDLAVGLKDFNQVIAVINGGAANFTLGATAPTGAEPRGMDIADVNGDGDLDLAVANRTGNSVTILSNNGNATFMSTTLAAGPEPRDAAFGSFDADGDFDLAVSCHDDRSVRVYTNTGGAFAMTTTLFVSAQDRPDGIDAGDLSGDGLDDIATATGDQVAANQNTVTVFLATGGMAFSGPAIYLTGPGATNTSDVVLADMDCDGDLDAAASNRDSNNVSVLANSGAGVFGPALHFAAGLAPETIIAADLDGDGDPSLVTANRNSANISVLLNTTCTPVVPCPWDLDGDGMIAVTDLVSLILAWGPNPGHPADFDGDGTVAVQDLVALVLNWGVCP